MRIANQEVKLTQSTRYPWDGAVKLQLKMTGPLSFTLHIRLPEWCEQYALAVNGVPQEIKPEANGYFALSRTWKDGDTVTYHLEMPIRAVWANPAVRQLEGRVALQRGPLVYCLEGADHAGIAPLDRIVVEAGKIASDWTATFEPHLLGGVTVLHGKGKLISAHGWGEQLYRSAPPALEDISLTAVPYCTWGNRAPGEMRVWLRTF